MYYLGQKIKIITKINTNVTHYLEAKVINDSGINTIPMTLLTNGSSVLDSQIYSLDLILSEIGQHIVLINAYTSTTNTTLTPEVFENLADTYREFNVVYNPLDELVRPHALTSGNLAELLLKILNKVDSTESAGDGTIKQEFVRFPVGTVIKLIRKSDNVEFKQTVGSSNKVVFYLKSGVYDVFYTNCDVTLGKNFEVINITGKDVCYG